MKTGTDMDDSGPDMPPMKVKQSPSNIGDVYKPNSEAHMASILKKAMNADGLSVFNKKNPTGKEIK